MSTAADTYADLPVPEPEPVTPPAPRARLVAEYGRVHAVAETRSPTAGTGGPAERLTTWLVEVRVTDTDERLHTSLHTGPVGTVLPYLRAEAEQYHRLVARRSTLLAFGGQVHAVVKREGFDIGRVAEAIEIVAERYRAAGWPADRVTDVRDAYAWRIGLVARD